MANCFEVLTVVVMKITVFWDITPCSPLKFNRRFGRTYHLHLQGRKISQQETSVKAGDLFFDPEDGGDVPPKRRLTFNGLHGVISQNMVLFKVGFI
jgi:hypothetical protein